MDCQLADVIVIWWCTCQLVWHVDWVSAVHPPLFWPVWWLNITCVILPMTCQQMVNQYIDRVLANMLAANTNYFFWVVTLSVIMYTRVNNRKISARCSCRIWWHARVWCWLWWWSWWCRSYPGFIKCRKESWCKTSHQGTLLYWFNIDSIPGC